MSNVTLSSVVRANQRLISSSLEKISCNAQDIAVIDIYPSVLSALVAKGAPASVAKSARSFMEASRRTQHAQQLSGDSSRNRTLRNEAVSGNQAVSTAPGSGNSNSNSIRKKNKSAGNEDSYLSCFNVGIAMSLHTVLLSRNRISTLLGIVQFKHCVSLSLLGNRIRTIEDCEPLAMLPDLQYLSLEYNPVTQLPHYRAHMLRICSWPQDLSPNTCRLRKLDSASVTTTEVKHAVICLRSEGVLMPELMYRMQLLSFLVDIENRQRLHYELRQRGHVLQDLSEHARMELLLERGVAHALSRIEVAGAAHLVRQLVHDRRLRPAASSSRTPQSTMQPPGRARTAAPPHFRTSATDDKAHCETVDATSTTITHVGSDALEQSDITSISAVSTNSLQSNNAPDHADLLQSLSHLLASKELDWSRRSLRCANASHETETCKAWSKDAFRQTIVFLDVRLCTLFLRISRVMGKTLMSHDVDRLCELWLHAVVHCTPAEAEDVNVTGSRRHIVDGDATLAGRQTTKKSAFVDQATIAQGEGILNRMVTGRIPVEAVAQLRTNIWDELGKETECLARSFSSSPHEEHLHLDTTTTNTRASMTSLTSDSVSLPRDSVPLPSAPPRADQTRHAESRHETSIAAKTPASIDAVAQQLAPDTGVTCADSIRTCEELARKRSKRHVFQRWCLVLRHRWQSRIATAYIREKVSDGAAAHVQSPSWCGLLSQVTYVERKRGFFNLWRRQTQLRRVLHSRQLRSVWNLWHQKATARNNLRLGYRLTSTKASMHMLGTMFRTWKSKAEKKASERCAAARRRILSDASHTRDEPPMAAPPTPVLMPLGVRTSSLRLTGVHHTLADTLTPGRETCAAAATVKSPVVMSVWRPSVDCEGDIRPPRAAFSVKKNEARDDCSACSSSDEEAGLSAVEAQPSNAVSTTKGAITPVVWATSTEGWQSPRPLCDITTSQAQPSGPTHEHSPPSAIRMLFPPALRDPYAVFTQCSKNIGAATVPTCLPPSSPWETRSALVSSVKSAVGLSPQLNPMSSKAQSSLRPNRPLPSTAARRAIVQASTVAERRMAPLKQTESPYPAADVEALVEQAKQLETDRDYLLETWRSHFCQEKQCIYKGLLSSGADYRVDPPPLSSSTLPRPSLTDIEELERQCTAQKREVHRLESLVAALQDERHKFLETIKSGLFRH